MFRSLVLVTMISPVVSCGPSPAAPRRPTSTSTLDPDGPHRAGIAAQIQPLLDAEIVTGLVVGVVDDGKREIYGFGRGPGGRPPTGGTLFEIGSVTKVFTTLLLADAVQRKEVTLTTPVAELLPPGITVPTKDGTAITLHHLALHTAGLPRLPPSLMAKQRPDPYAGYGEDPLYQDLIETTLDAAPGERVAYSNFGAGLLGFALGRRLGTDYAAALRERVLRPLALEHTHLGFPKGAEHADGTNDDLRPMVPWQWDALAGAGALVSNARDQLTLIEAELDAVTGSKRPLREAMRATQEDQPEAPGGGSGLGWVIDRDGRYWHNGGTGGHHAFVGFDPRNRRGIVILAATSTSLVDRLAPVLYAVLDGSSPAPPKFPTAEELAALAGTYDIDGTTFLVEARGKRLYIKDPEQHVRLLPLTGDAFFIDPLQAEVVFVRDGATIKGLVFTIGGQRLTAKRV